MTIKKVVRQSGFASISLLLGVMAVGDKWIVAQVAPTSQAQTSATPAGSEGGKGLEREAIQHRSASAADYGDIDFCGWLDGEVHGRDDGPHL
jgi:hypothetical protein